MNRPRLRQVGSIRAPAALAAALVLTPVAATGQVLSRPQRAADVVTPADPTRTVQTLVFTLDTTGGYDHNDAEDFAIDPESPSVFVEPAYTGAVDAGLTYARSRGTRSLGVMLNGSSNFYGGSNVDVGPSSFFGAGLSVTTPVGRASTFTAAQRLTYASLYSLGAFESIAREVGPGELPIDGPAQGVADLSSWTSDSTLSLARRVGRRNTVTGNYAFVRQVYTGEDFGDTSSHRASLSLARQVSRFLALNASYSYANGESAPLIGGGGTRPLVGHMVEGGFSYTKRLSPRRALQLAAGLGATRTDAVTGADESAYAFWAPSGHGMARIDLGRTWALSANYSRGTSALSGLTTEAYRSDAFGLSLGGSVGRAEMVLTGGVGRGDAGAGAVESSTYTTLTGAVQVSVPITQRLNALAQYSWYEYELTGTADVPSAIPTRYARGAIRAGLSIRLPIIETR